MTSLTLSKIFIYPVKSLAGIEVSSSPVDSKGLVHDRKWMLIDSDHQFLSQRRLAKMALINTKIEGDTLILSTSTSGRITLPLHPEGGDEIETTIWKDQCLAKTVSIEADQWLSDFLGIKCRLVYQPSHIIRPVDPNYAEATDKVNFSDGFPFLITSDASLASLNQEMNLQLPMQRFRPNLVISGCDSYEEDSWREIMINGIHFRLPKPCSRCPVPAINTDTGERGKEPLKTLNRLRRWNNRIFFGQNALHDIAGELSIGQTINIVKSGEKKPPL
jgi:uncharacterized protein YcbX